jgi:Holliday junction resolvasome RuvABC endonuclease subunit
MAILGIDPGKSGALALVGKRAVVDGEFVLVDETGVVELPFKLDNTERDIWECLVSWRPQIEFAYLEKVHSMPKQGVVSSFKFGQSYGFLRGMLIALEIPWEAVTPQKWQGALSCRTKGDKNITKARAQELFPDVRVTHALADALLIAEYGRRIRDASN